MTTIEKVQDKLFLLLKKFHEICCNNNISYSLFAGTLIGAIREKGFISWDDDADIIMERESFDILMQNIPAEYEIIRDPWVPRFKMKDTDLFIDIFVFDKTSMVEIKQKLHILQLKFIQGMLKKKPTKDKGGTVGYILSLTTYFIGRCFTFDYKIKMYDWIATKYRNKNTNFIFSSLDQYKYIKHILPTSIIGSYQLIDFEDSQLMIMNGYHEYLTIFYGDYMTPPSIEDQIPAHGNVK